MSTTSPDATPGSTTQPTGERADLLARLAQQRYFLRQTTNGLTDEQASTRSTVSELNLGGLIKHVAETEAAWARFTVEGAAGFGAGGDAWGSESGPTEEQIAAFRDGFRLVEGETLESVLARYEEVAARTDELIRTVDLDETHALPSAPWFEPGAVFTNRRAFLQVLGETAQHSGHADILREAIDGAKTMG